MGFLTDLLFPPRCLLCNSRRVDTKGLCSACLDAWTKEGNILTPGRAFSRCISAGWYRDSLRHALLQFKFEGKRSYAEPFGSLLAERIRFYLPGAYDCITWVPVSEERRKTRGYDQSRLIAEATAAALGKEAVPLLKKIKDTPAQSSLPDGTQRRRNVRGVYAVTGEVGELRVLLIDDIITTGATLEEAAQTLRSAGAVQVVCATVGKTPQDSHLYGEAGRPPPALSPLSHRFFTPTATPLCCRAHLW